MNVRSIFYILGWILILEAVFMLLPVATAVLYGESQGMAFVMTMAICGVVGGLLISCKPKHPRFYAREGFVITALCWIVMSAMGCIPFMLTGEIPRFVDAFFETVSGFTTTGASILTDVEALSRCSLMWRSFTHWIGGMGVLVFLLAVLPMVGGTNMQLMKAESPGPTVGKLVPKVRYTAQILYRLYVLLTVLQIVLLMVGGMDLFEALCISFGTAGTGGFGVRNSSIAEYSPYLQWVITVFMIAFGVNFNVYYLILLRKFKKALRCEEMRWYLAIILVAALMICVNIYDTALSVEQNVRVALFQVASVITTTGFSTVNFDLWPELSRAILVLLMFIGACAGSTGGGLKVSRIVMAGKSVHACLGSFLHPRSIRRIRFEGKDVDDGTLRVIFAYFCGMAGIFVTSVLIVSLENFDLISTFTAVATTINNVGPALGVAGPASNFSGFSDLSKWVMAFDMLAGRLEVFPMLMLFYPPLWKETIADARRRKRLGGVGRPYPARKGE